MLSWLLARYKLSTSGSTHCVYSKTVLKIGCGSVRRWPGISGHAYLVLAADLAPDSNTRFLTHRLTQDYKLHRVI